MHTTVTCPPAESTIWQARLDEGLPAVLAAIYRRAADLIGEHGYYLRPEGSCWELTGPHSISSAIDAAAISARPDKIDAEEIDGEAHIRLAGWSRTLQERAHDHHNLSRRRLPITPSSAHGRVRAQAGYRRRAGLRRCR